MNNVFIFGLVQQIDLLSDLTFSKIEDRLFRTVAIAVITTFVNIHGRFTIGHLFEADFTYVD
jgi:hypothetical protein